MTSETLPPEKEPQDTGGKDGAADIFNASFWQVNEPLLEVQKNKISFICSKGNLDMAYPALVMGAAALSENYEVNIFFTFWGFDLITKQTMDRLKFTMQGNTAMHMPLLEKLRPGWGKRYLPPSLGNLPGATHMATWYMRKMLDKQGIPPIRDLLEQVAETGGHLWACHMTMELMGIKKNQLFKKIDGIVTAPEFIRMSQGGPIIFI